MTMRFEIRLYQDGGRVVTRYVRELSEVNDWINEWKTYNQLKGDWEIRISPEEA